MNSHQTAGIPRIATRMQEWFVRARRDLPWRRTTDPYAIWISEVMLQQTQVATVIPYWERWMKLFPTVKALARSSESAVLKAWEGLGYYSRARNIHRAARMLVRDHCGVFPHDPDAIAGLPGIGPYTAGAIRSIAFNQPAAILDGNVTRVVSRLIAFDGDAQGKPGRKLLWATAQALVDAAKEKPHPCPPELAGSCSCLNQALMELGAMICKPSAPACCLCPVSDGCAGFQHGNPERFPRPKKRASSQRVRLRSVVFARCGRIFVGRRREGIINGGLWEFPTWGSAVRLCPGPENYPGYFLTNRIKARHLITIRHSITTHAIEIGFDVALLDQSTEFAKSLPSLEGDLGVRSDIWTQCRWLRLSDAAKLPFANAHAKALRALRGLESERGAQGETDVPLPIIWS